MRKTYMYGALAFGLLLTGCKSDDFLDSDGNVATEGQTFYVSLNIHGDVAGSTRAITDDGNPVADDNFDKGEGKENEVNNAYFVFYDEDGNVVGNIVPVTLENAAQGQLPTVDLAYKSVVPVVVRKGEKMPTQVICYINPISPSSLQTTLDMIQTVSRPQVSTTVGSGTSAKTYFAMSNSVYYKSENDAAPQIAVPIPSGALKTSFDDAQDALDGNTDIIDVYVERYATKLAFSYDDQKVENYQSATRVYAAEGGSSVVPVTLSFTPEYWTVNAQSKESYVIKSFRQDEGGLILPHNYSHAALDAIINTATEAADGWKWNNADYHRSYWGMSPAYFQSTYPEVQSDLDPSLCKQDYFTYNQLVGSPTQPSVGFAATNTAPQYFKETTVGSIALASNNPAAAVASVIFVGKYKISVNGGTPLENTDFYTYLSGPVTTEEGVKERPYVYFANNPGTAESAVAGGESILKRFLAQATVLYKKEDDGSFSRLEITDTDDLANLVATFEVSKIDPKVMAYVGTEDDPFKLQANARSLQFKSAAAAVTNNIYIASGNGYKKLVADDTETVGTNEIRFSEANATLMQQVGYAYYYNTGMAFFNIPVKHYGWYRKNNTQKNDATIDWGKVRVGDFGMVRNHSYTVNVSEIKGLATGISGPDVEIIPESSTKDYFVAYTVRILKWAVVPQQDVKL